MKDFQLLENKQFKMYIKIMQFFKIHTQETISETCKKNKDVENLGYCYKKIFLL